MNRSSQPAATRSDEGTLGPPKVTEQTRALPQQDGLSRRVVQDALTGAERVGRPGRRAGLGAVCRVRSSISCGRNGDPLYTPARRNCDVCVQAARLRDGESLPRFVEQEFRNFLRCGSLAESVPMWRRASALRAAARFRCDDRGLDRLVPFSGKPGSLARQPRWGGKRGRCVPVAAARYGERPIWTA